MLHRRALLQGFSGVIVAGASRALAAPALNERTYRGKVRYMSGAEDNGFETFSCTIQPGGARILRVQCEMYADRLLRDVTMTLDADWRPVTAFVQLTVNEKFVGATWYHFSTTLAEAEGFTVNEGRVAQRFALAKPVDCFVAHPIHNDSWHLARLRRNGGQPVGPPEFASSLQGNGGTGPSLVPFPADYLRFAMVGAEHIKVPAGDFAAEHFTMTVVPKQKVMNIWAFGEDCIPLRLVSSAGTYELVELSGDPR